MSGLIEVACLGDQAYTSLEWDYRGGIDGYMCCRRVSGRY